MKENDLVLTKKINVLNQQRSNIMSELSQYEKAKAVANQLIKMLNNTESNLSRASTCIKENFIINGNLGDNGKTNSLLTNISSISSAISSVIQGINNKISELNSNLSRIESQTSDLYSQMRNQVK